MLAYTIIRGFRKPRPVEIDMCENDNNNIVRRLELLGPDPTPQSQSHRIHHMDILGRDGGKVGKVTSQRSCCWIE